MQTDLNNEGAENKYDVNETHIGIFFQTPHNNKLVSKFQYLLKLVFI